MSLTTTTIVKNRHDSLNGEKGTDTVFGDRVDSSVLTSILKIGAVAVFCAGLVPFFFICWLIASSGANNVCVDYAAFLHVVDKVLSGQYQWFSIFSDSFIRTHLVLFPVLLHTAIAYLTHWDVTTELYVGMAIHVSRALLLADLVSNRIVNGWTRLAVTGGVFGLVFAMTQTCIMIYGEASIAIGLNLLGFTFALWALCKYGRTPRGLALMVAGGVLSSYSFGNVLPCWLTLGAAMLLLPPRGWKQHWDVNHAGFYSALKQQNPDGITSLFVNKNVSFGYWFIGALVSIVPYYYFLSNRATVDPTLTKTFGFWNAEFLINVLGRPFAKDMGLVYGRLPGAEVSAGILLAVIVALAVPVICSRLRLCNTTRICSLLFMYGFLSIWAVGVFRTHIAPWYASMSLYCWLAVFGVACANLNRAFNPNVPMTKNLKLGFAASSIAALGTILVLYLVTNVSYRDKQFFLNSRAPVSGEYLREYATAPTYLESTIFSNDGRPDRILSFADSLKRHDLCVFAPNQSWSLQGQFALSSVDVERLSGSKRVMWLDGRSLRGLKSWRDYQHLNLLVPDGNIVEWRFNVPEDAKEAVFKTSVSSFKEAAGECADKASKVVSTISVFSDAPNAVSDRASVLARNNVQSSGGASYVTCCDDTWKPMRLNLLPYRGKTVTIRLGLSSQGDLYSGLCDDRNCIPSSVLFQYPHIDIVKNSTEHHGASPPNTVALCPSNTDLSPQFPYSYYQRFDLPPVNSSEWKDVPMGLPEDAAYTVPAKFWTVPDEQKIAVDGFDYLTMQLEPMPGKSWCSLKMHLQFDDGTTDGFSMPLLSDASSHKYVYPVKLLTEKGGAKLVGVLAFASAVDANPNPKATSNESKKESTVKVGIASTEAIANADSDVQTANSAVPLSGCIRINNLAFIKSTPTLSAAR